MTGALPTGVAEAIARLDAVDAALGRGLARLGPAEADALDGLAAAHAGGPLGALVAEAVLAVRGGQPHPHQLVALAAGREAVWGAVHDALLAEALAQAGLTLAPSPAGADAPRPPEADGPLAALQHNLVEVALAGTAALDRASLQPMVEVLAPLQAQPAMARAAALATGLLDELLEHAPTSALAAPPLRRWADLWSRALLATAFPPTAPAAAPVTGRLSAFGAALHSHDHLVSLVVHGLLEHGGQRTLVRLGTSAWRVDAVAGPEVWELLADRAPELVALVRHPSMVDVEGSLLSTGWLTVGRFGQPAPLAVEGLALEGAQLCAPSPRDRHPAALAVPVVGAPAPADPARLAAAQGLGDEPALFSLLGWDGDWVTTPLLSRKGKRLVTAALEAKSKGDAVAVLRERASKLLRSS